MGGRLRRTAPSRKAGQQFDKAENCHPLPRSAEEPCVGATRLLDFADPARSLASGANPARLPESRLAGWQQGSVTDELRG